MILAITSHSTVQFVRFIFWENFPSRVYIIQAFPRNCNFNIECSFFYFYIHISSKFSFKIDNNNNLITVSYINFPMQSSHHHFFNLVYAVFIQLSKYNCFSESKNMMKLPFCFFIGSKTMEWKNNLYNWLKRMSGNYWKRVDKNSSEVIELQNQFS